MDTRDTPEQAELRRSARQLARERSAAAVPDLDDLDRAKRLAAGVRDAGWLELRDDGGEGGPLAGGEESAIVADALGGTVADVAFTGPLLARDLARRAQAAPDDDVVIACSADLSEVAVVDGTATTRPLFAVDGPISTSGAYLLVPDGDAFRLAHLPLDGASEKCGADLTRRVEEIPEGTPITVVEDAGRALTATDVVAAQALGLALTSADLVGIMRGVTEISVAYAADRRQYGVPVGSFQAVQHLLAEAECLMEGALSVSLHAAWAVDNLEPHEARAAGRAAKAYAARASRTVCETAVQVHGGIGNTWECIVHVYLRRALLSAQWFGDDAMQVGALGRERLEAV